MLGNDVVDLADADADPSTYHRRWERRVFSDAEQSWVAQSEQRLRSVWRLWAAKEAAYKLARREDARVVFSPRSFRVCTEAARISSRFEKDASPIRGFVEHAGQSIPFVIEEREDYIHAWTGIGDVLDQQTIHEVARVPSMRASNPEGPSLAVRRAFRDRAADILGVARERLSFGRNDRAPVLLVDGAPRSTHLSFSHHGRFVAWVWRSPTPVSVAPQPALAATRSLA